MNARGGGKTKTWLALRPSFPSSSFHTKKSTSFNSMDPYPLLSFPSSQDFPLFPRRFFLKKERKGFSSLPLTNAKLALAKVFLYFFWCLLPPTLPWRQLQSKRRGKEEKVTFRISYDLPLLSLDPQLERIGKVAVKNVRFKSNVIFPKFYLPKRGGGEETWRKVTNPLQLPPVHVYQRLCCASPRVFMPFRIFKGD